jgi:hypothetical protein
LEFCHESLFLSKSFLPVLPEVPVLHCST